MEIETAIFGIAAIFLVLALLALANWRDLARDREVAEDGARFFVEKELVRVRLRFAGWAVLSAAMVLRLVLPDSDYRALFVLGMASLAGAVFIAEAIMGRLERRAMLRGDRARRGSR